MIRTIFRWLRRSTVFGLALIGALALVLTAMMAVPVSRPPMMQSVINGVRTVDRSDMPQLSRFQARDGTELAYRDYRRAPLAPAALRLCHGSSGGSPRCMPPPGRSQPRASRPTRSTCAAMAHRARVVTSLISASSRMISPIWSGGSGGPMGRAPDPDRALGRRWICAAGRRLSAPE